MSTNSLQLDPTGEQFTLPNNWNERNHTQFLYTTQWPFKKQTLEISTGLFSCLSQAYCMALFRCQYNKFNRVTSTITLCSDNVWLISKPFNVKWFGKKRGPSMAKTVLSTLQLIIWNSSIVQKWIMLLQMGHKYSFSAALNEKCDFLVCILHRYLPSFQINSWYNHIQATNNNYNQNYLFMMIR